MGFVKTISVSGREVYACEAGMQGCTGYPCRAHKCPHGWCQRYYFCANCWKQLRADWSSRHEKCEENHALYVKEQNERKRLEDAGEYIRVAALGKSNDVVRVVFRNKDGHELGYEMTDALYDSFDIGKPVTLSQFMQAGECTESTTDLYA